MKQYASGVLLPRGQVFSLFNERHRQQMITIFESFFFAEDWDTFFRTACYVRDRVNEGQFIYALSVAVLHRQDTRGIVLPPAYEIYPHLFVNSEVIHAAYKAKMRQEPAVVRMNFTGKQVFLTVHDTYSWEFGSTLDCMYHFCLYRYDRLNRNPLKPKERERRESGGSSDRHYF
jgi:hypothetical protein